MTEINPMVTGEAGATAESEDEKRKRKQREAKRRQRSAQRAVKAAATKETLQQWWEGNRAQLKPTERQGMEGRHNYIVAVMESMALVQHKPRTIQILNKRGEAVSTETYLETYKKGGSGYKVVEAPAVCLDPELVEIIQADIDEHGTIHFRFQRDQSIGGGWFYGGREGVEWSGRFWQDPTRLRKIEEESEGTALWARFGFLTAFPDDAPFPAGVRTGIVERDGSYQHP